MRGNLAGGRACGKSGTGKSALENEGIGHPVFDGTRKMRLLVCVSGGGTNLQAIIDACRAGELENAEIVRVISSREDSYALVRAARAGMEGVCISPKDIPDREVFHRTLLQAVDDAKPDLIVLAGFLVILSREMVARYRNRIINIHPSLIPSFCGTGCYGLKVHQAALARGVKITGATVHFVDEGTDSGPIILQRAVMVQENDTPEVLQRRVMEEAEWIVLPEAIRLISEGRVSVAEGRVFVR